MVQTRFRFRQQTLGKRKGKEEEEEETRQQQTTKEKKTAERVVKKQTQKQKQKQHEKAKESQSKSTTKQKKATLRKPPGQNLVLHNMVEDGVLPPGTPLAFLTDSGIWWRGHISHCAPYVIEDDQDPSISGYRFPGPWVNAVIQRREEKLREVDKLQTLSELSQAVQDELDMDQLEELGCSTEGISSVVYATLEALNGMGKISRTYRENIKPRDGTWDQIRAYASLPHYDYRGELQQSRPLPARDNPETWHTLSDFKQLYSSKRAKMDWRKRVVERIHYTLDRIVKGMVPAELVEYETGINRFLSSTLDFGLWIVRQTEEISSFVKSQQHSPEESCEQCRDGKSHLDGTQLLCSKMLQLLSRSTPVQDLTNQSLPTQSPLSDSPDQQEPLLYSCTLADYELNFKERMDDSHPLFCFFAQVALLRFLKDDLQYNTDRNRFLQKHQTRIAQLMSYIDKLEQDNGLVRRKKRCKKITTHETYIPFEATAQEFMEEALASASCSPTEQPLSIPPSTTSTSSTSSSSAPISLRQSCPAVLSLALEEMSVQRQVESTPTPLQATSHDPNVFSTYAPIEAVMCDFPSSSSTTTINPSTDDDTAAVPNSVSPQSGETHSPVSPESSTSNDASVGAGDFTIHQPVLFAQGDYYYQQTSSTLNFEGGGTSDAVSGLIPFLCTESPVSRSLSPVITEMQLDVETMEPFFLPEDTLSCLQVVEHAVDQQQQEANSREQEKVEVEVEKPPVVEPPKKGWWLDQKKMLSSRDILSFTIPAKVQQSMCVL